MPKCHLLYSTCVFLIGSGLIHVHPFSCSSANAQTHGKPIATQIGRFFGWGYSQGGYHSSSNGSAARAHSNRAPIATNSPPGYWPGYIHPNVAYPRVDAGGSSPVDATRETDRSYPNQASQYRPSPGMPSVPAPRMEAEQPGLAVDSNRRPFPSPHPAEEVTPHATRPTAVLGLPAPAANPAYRGLQPLRDSSAITPLPDREPRTDSGERRLDPDWLVRPTQPESMETSEDLLHDFGPGSSPEEDLLLDLDADR